MYYSYDVHSLFDSSLAEGEKLIHVTCIATTVRTTPRNMYRARMDSLHADSATADRALIVLGRSVGRITQDGGLLGI